MKIGIDLGGTNMRVGLTDGATLVIAVMMLAGVMTACTERVTQQMEWQVQSSDKVSETGDVLSTPAAKTDGWIAAMVPSTLMGILTINGIEPEALTAEDYAKIDKTQFEKSWWYRTTFNLPTLKDGEHALLDFDGICYRANVWLNGKQIANSQEMAGAFRQFEFDVTQEIDKENVLAVEVFRAQPGETEYRFCGLEPETCRREHGYLPRGEGKDLWGCSCVALCGTFKGQRGA